MSILTLGSKKRKERKFPIKEWEKAKRKERKFSIKEWEKVKKEEEKGKKRVEEISQNEREKIRDLEIFNRTLVGKWLWSLLNEKKGSLERGFD